jgi:hypothetical protein
VVPQVLRSSGAIKQRAFRGGLGAWAPWDLGRALASAVMVVGDPLCHQAPVPVSGGVTMGNASFGVVAFGPACEGPPSLPDCLKGLIR